MFEWLEHEISEIKTPLFHVVDGPADAILRQAVMGSPLPLPDSYCQFVLKFGNARLYRDPRNSGYEVGVFAGPREAMLADGTTAYQLGFHDGAKVYVKRTPASPAMPIYEFEEDYEERVADSFEEWLLKSCAQTRRRIGKKKWQEIVDGPTPFTSAERDVVETRRQIKWRVVGMDESGKRLFEVTNGGNHPLPALTLGVRSKDGRLNGAVYLPVRDILPGRTAIVHANCYKDLLSPDEIEIFALPDPSPADRERYAEFTDTNACQD